MSGLSIKANEDRPLLGIGLMLIAYLAFSLIDTSAKWLVLAGMASLQAAFMRYVGHFLISLGMMVRQGVNPTVFRSNHFWLVILRAFFLAASTALNFISVRYLPLTLTATILFSAPIIVCALSGPLLNERVGIWRWSAILIGFVGIVVAMRPVDFRRGHDGLAATVQNELGLDPHSGLTVVFRSKRGDRIKVLVWDGTGLVLIYKRLESGSFTWPKVQDGVMRLSRAQFEALFEGLDWRRVMARRVAAPVVAG